MNDLAELLQDFHRDKLAELLRHQAGARHIRQYDLNNAYQYFLNRDNVHLSWVAAAITDLGALIQPASAEPDIAPLGRDPDAWRHIVEADARGAQLFVDRWRPRIDQMANARHAKMLRVILGEVLEQKRFFEQALAGRTDLLGRRGDTLEPSHGEVLPGRWIE